MRIVHEQQGSISWTELASSPAPPKRTRSLAAWCRDCCIDAFAGYAHAMYPVFADPGEELAWREREFEELLRQPAVSVSESVAPWLYALDPWTSEGSFQPHRAAQSPGWFSRVRSAVARLRERMRSDHWARRTTADLAALDDNSLKDIGLHRSQIESVARYGDPLRS